MIFFQGLLWCLLFGLAVALLAGLALLLLLIGLMAACGAAMVVLVVLLVAALLGAFDHPARGRDLSPSGGGAPS